MRRPHLPGTSPGIQPDPQPLFTAPADEPDVGAPHSPLAELLHRQARVAVPLSGGSPPAPGQILLGRLRALPAGGQPGLADVPGLGSLHLCHSLVPWSPEQIGQGVALSLVAPGQALLLGLVWQAAASAPGEPDAATAAGCPPLALTVDGRRKVVKAEQELELRCGEAAILLSADGRIQLRGTYITSHASATQRIVGASVHVN